MITFSLSLFDKFTSRRLKLGFFLFEDVIDQCVEIQCQCDTFSYLVTTRNLIFLKDFFVSGRTRLLSFFDLRIFEFVYVLNKVHRCELRSEKSKKQFASSSFAITLR